jgi:hypothetical protein
VRQLDGDGRRAEAGPHAVHDGRRIGAGAVALVDKGDARDLVAVGLAPHRLALRLDAADGVEDGDGAIEDPQAALDFHGEVDVARGVDQVDEVLTPAESSGGSGDADAALLLLLHPVGEGRAVMDLAEARDDAGVEQDALGRGRLACVDVRDDPDVADLRKRSGPSHVRDRGR